MSGITGNHANGGGFGGGFGGSNSGTSGQSGGGGRQGGITGNHANGGGFGASTNHSSSQGSTGPGSSSAHDPRGNEGLGGVNSPGMGGPGRGIGAGGGTSSSNGAGGDGTNGSQGRGKVVADHIANPGQDTMAGTSYDGVSPADVANAHTPTDIARDNAVNRATDNMIDAGVLSWSGVHPRNPLVTSPRIYSAIQRAMEQKAVEKFGPFQENASYQTVREVTKFFDQLGVQYGNTVDSKLISGAAFQHYTGMSDPAAFSGAVDRYNREKTLNKGQVPDNSPTLDHPPSLPVVLDLTGNGINLTEMNNSNQFIDFDDDGYAQRTAWAGVGNGVLVFDVDGDGKISQSKEFVFTKWDPTASSDMQALKDVFDTNHNGKLDAGDAQFSSFKVMVTNADGTTTMKSLAELGIQSIDLTPDATKITLPDGTTIDGKTTYTRTDGTTRTVATVSFATDANGYALNQTITHNADGSTTIDNKALNADGSVANETIGVTSSDGLRRTLSYDLNGDGVIDKVQTVVTVPNGDGSKTETLTNKNGGGILIDKTVTTTSADGKTITIQRDQRGGGYFTQTEVRSTNADNSTSIALSDLNPDGTLKGKVITTTSGDGLTRTVQSDLDGNNITDLTETDATVVNADGSRTETVTETNSDGSLRDRTITVFSASGQNKTITEDFNGDGVIDLTTVSSVVVTVGVNTVTTQTETNADGSLRDKIVTTLTADGLSTITQTDLTGDGVFDVIKSDVTVVGADGSRTQTVSVTNTDGSMSSKIITAKGADGRSRNVQTDANGDSKVDQTEVIVVNADGTSTDTLINLNADGTTIDKTVTTSSADGLSVTTQVDHTGNGTFDLTSTDVTVKNADGSSTETITDKNANGTVWSKAVIATSANGLTVTTQTDHSGSGTFDITQSDARILNADGSQVETVTETNANGSLHAKTITNTSADRRNISITRDFNGDNANDQTETIVIQANGSTVDTLKAFSTNGTLINKVVTTETATGLSTTTQVDYNADGVYDLTTIDVTILNNDGSRTETITDAIANGSLRDKTVVTVNATGLSTVTQIDHAGSGTFDRTITDVTVLNTDGSRTETTTDTNGNGVNRDQVSVTTNASGLSKSTTVDVDGNGTIDITTTDVTVLNADGSRVTTVTDLNGSGSVLDQTVNTISADRRRSTIVDTVNGSVPFKTTEVVVTQDNGNVVDTVSHQTAAGALLNQTITTTSANGLNVTTQRDQNGDGVIDLTTTDATVINVDGSRTETITESNTSGLINKTVATTSANALSKTTQMDANGDGTFEATRTDVTTLNTDGSITETVTDTAANGAQRDKIVTVTSADKKTVTVTESLGTTVVVTETIAVQADGSTIDTATNKTSAGAALSTFVTTTSANHLSRTVQTKNSAGTVVDTQSDVTTLNADGSRTETFTQTGAVSDNIVTTSSANGLSKTITTTLTGTTTFSVNTSDVTVLNSDGSQTDTITDNNTNATLHDKTTITISANGLSSTILIDENGDGQTDISDILTYDVSGSSVETLRVYNPSNRFLVQKDVISTSADGRTISLQRDADGNGILDHYETIVLNADGSVTDTTSGVAAFNFAPAYSQLKTSQLNADGSQTVTVTDYDGYGVLQSSAATTTSANGLTKTTQLDSNGDGIADLTLSDATALNSDGSKTETISSVYAGGALKSKTIVTTSADRHAITYSFDKDGNGVAEQTSSLAIAADGSYANTVTLFNNTTGAQTSQQKVTVDATGLVKTLTNGTIVDTTTSFANAHDSYQWARTVSSSSAGRSSHMVDAGNVDTWSWAVTSSTLWAQSTADPVVTSSGTIQIDLASEDRDLGLAAGFYGAAYGRAMTDAEQEFLAQYIQNGSLNTTLLASNILNSSEFTTRYGTLTNGAFVTQIYRNAFGYVPSASSLQAFLGQLGTGTTRAQIFAAIVQSAEDLGNGNGLPAIIAGEHILKPEIASPNPGDQEHILNMGSDYEYLIQNMTGRSSALTSGQLAALQSLLSASGPGGNAQSANVRALIDNGVAIDGIFAEPTWPATVAAIPTVSVTGTTNTVNQSNAYVTLTANAKATVNGHDDLITQTSNTTLTLTGADNFIDVTSTGNTTNVSGTLIALESGAGDTVNGNNNQIIQTSNSALTVTGTGAVLSVTGTGNTASITGAQITAQKGSGITVTGNNNVVTERSNATVTLNGTGESVDITETGATANLTSGIVTLENGISATVGGNSNTITMKVNTTLTATGTSDIIDVIGTGVVVGVNSGNVTLEDGSSATINGNSNTIGLHSMASITTSGTGDIVNISGSSTWTNYVRSLNSGTVNIALGSSVDVSGSGNTISMTADAAHQTKLFVEGSSMIVNAIGANDFVDLSANTTNTVNVNNGVVWLEGSAAAAVNGSGNHILLRSNNNSLTINGSNNTVSENYTNQTGMNIDVFGTQENFQTWGAQIKLETGSSVTISQGSNNTTVFHAGVADDQVWFQKSGNDLVVSVLGATDKETVTNWFSASGSPTDNFQLSDGTYLQASAVQQLVNAMSSWSTPPASISSLPPDQQQSLETTIAASWHAPGT